MAPFPLLLTDLLGKTGAYLVFLVIGFGFGFVLESSGFNHSPTLAAQFYFKDLRVFKVFFTAIVVGMLLMMDYMTALNAYAVRFTPEWLIEKL